MTTKPRDWRGKREYNRRRDALQRIIDNPDNKPSDIFNALEMLDAWQGVPELKAGVARLTGEVERLTSEVAARDTEITRLGAENTNLTTEVDRLKNELAETNVTLTEANDWIEAHQEVNQ